MEIEKDALVAARLADDDGRAVEGRRAGDLDRVIRVLTDVYQLLLKLEERRGRARDKT